MKYLKCIVVTGVLLIAFSCRLQLAESNSIATTANNESNCKLGKNYNYILEIHAAQEEVIDSQLVQKGGLSKFEAKFYNLSVNNSALKARLTCANDSEKKKICSEELKDAYKLLELIEDRMQAIIEDREKHFDVHMATKAVESALSISTICDQYS